MQAMQRKGNGEMATNGLLEMLREHYTSGRLRRRRKMQWGGTAGANNFHRTVTNTTVKWIIYVLETYWKPTIDCYETIEWIRNRELAGFTGLQALPATVDGFLDDFIIALCGTPEDKEIGRLWVLVAIDFLGMTL